MKKLLTLATCLTLFGLVGCSSYENSNQLPEEDKFLAPSGIHELPHFISLLNEASTYDVVVYDEVSGMREFKADNNLKFGYINSVEIVEMYSGGSFFIYETNNDVTLRRNSADNAFDIIPFDLDKLEYAHFDYVDFSSTYELKQSLLEEYNIDGLYITYDEDIENVIFSVKIDDELTDYTITLNDDKINVPEEYEHTLEDLDKIEDFFVNRGYDSYLANVYFLEKEANNVGKYVLQSKHTGEYSRAVYWDAIDTPSGFTYIKYDGLGGFEYVDINGNPDVPTFTTPEYMESSVYKNMFTTETVLNIYDVLKDSYYDSETELYYWYSEEIDYLFSIDFAPDALGTEEDAQVTVQFKWVEPNGTLVLWHLRYHSFGNVDYNDFMELVIPSSSYVNLIK